MMDFNFFSHFFFRIQVFLLRLLYFIIPYYIIIKFTIKDKFPGYFDPFVYRFKQLFFTTSFFHLIFKIIFIGIIGIKFTFVDNFILFLILYICSYTFDLYQYIYEILGGIGRYLFSTFTGSFNYEIYSISGMDVFDPNLLAAADSTVNQFERYFFGFFFYFPFFILRHFILREPLFFSVINFFFILAYLQDFNIFFTYSYLLFLHLSRFLFFLSDENFSYKKYNQIWLEYTEIYTSCFDAFNGKYQYSGGYNYVNAYYINGKYITYSKDLMEASKELTRLNEKYGRTESFPIVVGNSYKSSMIFKLSYYNLRLAILLSNRHFIENQITGTTCNKKKRKKHRNNNARFFSFLLDSPFFATVNNRTYIPVFLNLGHSQLDEYLFAHAHRFVYRNRFFWFALLLFFILFDDYITILNLFLLEYLIIPVIIITIKQIMINSIIIIGIIIKEQIKNSILKKV